MGRRRAWRLEDDEHLRQLAVAGYSRHAIALKLGRPEFFGRRSSPRNQSAVSR